MLAKHTGVSPQGSRRACRRAALGVACLGMLMAAVPARAEPPSSAGAPSGVPGLTVAVVDLSDVPGLVPRPPEARRPAWRTTFGSERVTEPVVESGGDSLAALAEVDAVLIQGVRGSARLRRLFPPRNWRLIVSRRALSATDPVGFRGVRSDLPPTTAIAVKARQDLRITARVATLALDRPGGSAASEAERATATAVRLVDRGGRALWLASAALPPSCSAEAPACGPLETLDAWRREQAGNGEPALIAGGIARPATAAAEEATSAGDAAAGCASHAIETDLPWERVPPAAPAASAVSPPSCISIIRIDG